MHHSLKQLLARKQEGFTLVEIGVVVPILMLLALGLFSVMFSYLLSSNREQVKLYQAYSQSSALDRLEADIRLSTAFLQTQDTSTPDPYSSNQKGGAAWNFAGSDSTHNVLIMREYSTANNPLSPVRTPVYQRTSTAPNCNQAEYIVGPLSYDIIYFVSNSTLFKRTLINTSAPTCTSQYQKLSCPSVAILGTSRDPSCSADDEIVAQNVSGFSATYYADQTTTTPLDTANSPGLISSARSVNITVSNQQSSYNGQVSSSSSLRTISQNSQTSSGGNQ